MGLTWLFDLFIFGFDFVGCLIVGFGRCGFVCRLLPGLLELYCCGFEFCWVGMVVELVLSYGVYCFYLFDCVRRLCLCVV